MNWRGMSIDAVRAELHARNRTDCDLTKIHFVCGSRVDSQVQPLDPARDMTQLAAAAAAIGDVSLMIVDPVVSAIAEDLSQYALLMKRSARLEADAGPGFMRDAMTWRMILRVTGQPMWDEPITPYSGGPTLSWATYLGARA